MVKRDTVARADAILISSSVDSFQIDLRKVRNVWQLYLDDSHVYPGRTERIVRFLEELSKERRLHINGQKQIRSRINSDQILFSVRLLQENGAILSDLEFGSTTAGGDERFVQTGTSLEVLRIDDSVSEFLDTRASSWAALDVFSEFLGSSDIQRVVFRKKEQQREFIAGKNPEVAEFQKVLESASCIDITNIPSVGEETFYIELGDARHVRYRISALPSSDMILTDEGTGASYIISAWTKERIDRSLGFR